MNLLDFNNDFKRFCLIALLCIFTLNLYGYEVGPYNYPAYTLKGNSFSASLFGRQFNSTSKIDSNGNEVAYDANSSFITRDGGIALKYGITSRFETRLGATYRENTSESPSGSIVNSGPESYFIGLKYSLVPTARRLVYGLDLRVKNTAYSNEVYSPDKVPQDEIVLGDHGVEFMGGIHISYKRKKNHILSLSAMYNRPPNDLSPEIILKLENGWIYKKWAIILGADSIYALGSDEYSDNPEDKPVIARGDTEKYNSINRQIVMPYIGISRTFNSVRAGFRYGQVVIGKSTDLGQEFKGYLTWQPKTKTNERTRDEVFKEYEVEGTVIKVSANSSFIKIDQGIANDFSSGMTVDIFKSDFFGGNILIATGVVYKIGATWSIVKIIKRHTNNKLAPGLVARAY